MDLTIKETFTTDVEAANSPTFTHNVFNGTQTLQSSSAVPASKCIARTLALTAGALTIDLTALVGSGGVAVDFTGLKVQAVLIANPSTHDIVFTFGASNGYLLLGTGWKFTLKAGQKIEFFLNNLAPSVDGTHKTVDITGTGTDTFNIELVAG